MSNKLTEGTQVKIEKCLTIDNSKESYECVKSTISKLQQTEKCRPRLILITQKNCPYCDIEKENISQDIESGLVQVVDISTVEGKMLTDKNDIDFTPALLLIDCDGNIIE